MAAMFELGPGAGAIRRDTAAPLHAQISTAIRSRIVTGEWPEDHRLSPEPQLAEEIGVSRGTLRRALATLIDEGLLRQIRGRGTFVTRSMMEPAAAQRLSTLSEDFASQGLELETTILEAGLRSARAEVAILLGVAPDARVFQLVRVRHTAGTPIALVHNYVVAELAPGIEDLDFSRTTLFGALEGRYGLAIDSARRSFSAVGAAPEVADALGLPEGTPVQYLEQLTSLVDRRPIEYSDVWIDSSRLRVVTYMSRRAHERKRTP